MSKNRKYCTNTPITSTYKGINNRMKQITSINRTNKKIQNPIGR